VINLLILVLKFLDPVLHGLDVQLQLLLYSDVLPDITFELLDQVLVHLGARSILLRDR